MLKNYLGGDIFKAGLTSYLKKYTYSNAATKDLWNSFSGVITVANHKLLERLFEHMTRLVGLLFQFSFLLLQ